MEEKRASTALRISAQPGLVAIRGPLEDNVTHRHHALQISIALEGHVRADGGPASEGLLILPDHDHRLRAHDALTLLIDPETTLARELIASSLEEGPLRSFGALDASSTLGELLGRLRGGPILRGSLDPRIAEILTWMDEEQAVGRTEELTLAAALRRAHLSESRFLHLFREETGITWRRTLIWRRALVAMRFVSEGLRLTEAAHRAGYADSAHFSRQFKELFGFTPSAIAKKSRFVQADELLGDHALS